MNELKCLYRGKTKDVYELPGGRALLHFKDDVTGADGVFDPGANTVGLTIEGVGRANLMMSAYYFELLEKMGIATHYIACDADAGTMEVVRASPIGQGLEVICRYRAVGSFIRRYGAYIEEGAPLDAYVEITLKDDARGDPLITQDGLAALQIMDEQAYARVRDLTRRIAGAIRDDLAQRGMELYDIKLEFGTADGAFLLIDEVSSGNMRVMKDGRYMAPEALTAAVLRGEGGHA